MKDYKSIVFVGIFLILLIIITVGCTEEELDELVKEIGEVVSDQVDETIEDIKKDVEEKKDELIDNIRPGSKEGKAIKWARSKLETSYGRDNCHNFVIDAYIKGAGIPEDNFSNYIEGGAIGVYNRHKISVHKTEPPPPGTMVLYRNGDVPHTALSLDKEGYIIHNNTRNGVVVVEECHFKWLEKIGYEYLGWIDVVNN